MSAPVGLELVWAAPDALERRAWVESLLTPPRAWEARHDVLREGRPDASSRDALVGWCRARGLRVGPRSPYRARLSATAQTLVTAFGPAAARALVSRGGFDARLALPPRWRGFLARMDVATAVEGRWRRARRCVIEPRSCAPPDTRGTTPEAARRALGMPASLRGDAQHVAIMSLGGTPHLSDLRRFVGAFGLGTLALDQVELGQISEAARSNPMYRHETTMMIQWVYAMAPRARVTVVSVDAIHTADPWAAFYEELLDPAGTPASVAVTSWSAPEGQVRRAHGREVSTTRLAQLASVGCTVVTASGDWGVLPGFPSQDYEGHRVFASSEPEVVYPACESYVLSVGGTCGFGPDAAALCCALSPALANALPIRGIASSGGFSKDLPTPPWQRPHLRPTYARGPNLPALLSTGRGVPDLAMPAWGTPSDAEAACGYTGFIDGRWRDDLGGTSLGAGLFAAGLALINEARAQVGAPSLGWCIPQLYALASSHPEAFTPVRRGATDLVAPLIDACGDPIDTVVPGFVATDGWDPLTGLGIPRLDRLLAALVPSVVALGNLPGPQGCGALPQAPRRGREFLDACPEQLEPPPQPAANGSTGDPERLLELAPPDLLEIVEFEGHLQVDGNVPQRLQEQLSVLSTLKDAAGGDAEIGHRGLAQRGPFWMTHSRAQDVVELAAGHGEQVSPEPSGLNPIASLDAGDERLLDEVLDPFAHLVDEEPPDRLEVSLEQRFPGGLVSATPSLE